MPSFPHKSNRRIIIRVLETNLIRHQLIVQSRGGEGLRRGETLIEDVPEVLDGGGDDAGAAGGTDDDGEGVVGSVFDDGRGDGGEGAFAGADVV